MSSAGTKDTKNGSFLATLDTDERRAVDKTEKITNFKLRAKQRKRLKAYDSTSKLI
jgi:hypothetical protein